MRYNTPTTASRRHAAGLLLRGIAVLCAPLVVATACSSSSTSSPAAPELASASDGTPGTPLLEFDEGTTWIQLLNAVGNSQELECIDKTIDSEDLPGDFLDLEVVDPTVATVTWPVWQLEVVGLEVGSSQWPSEIWKCLAPETAAAVYLSVEIEGLRLTGLSIEEQDKSCLMELPTDPDLSGAIRALLTSKASFDKGETINSFMMDLDEQITPRILSCISDIVTEIIDGALDIGLDAFGDAISGNQRSCIKEAVKDDISSGDLDPAPLFGDEPSDDYFDNTFMPRLFAALEVCNQAMSARPTVGVEFEIDPTTTWQELFDALIAPEQDCIRESLDAALLTEALASLVLVDGDDPQWAAQIWQCLRPEIARGVFVSVIVSDIEQSVGVDLDTDHVVCLQDAFADIDVGHVIAASISGTADEDSEDYADIVFGLLSCLPEEAFGQSSSTGTESAPSPPATALQWQTPIGGAERLVLVSPTVLDGIVFAADYDGGAFALDTETGQVLWDFQTARDLSPPAIVGAGVVHLIDLDTHYALDAYTGEFLWSRDSTGRPEIRDGTAYLTSSGRGDQILVVALHERSGRELWATDVGQMPFGFLLSITSDEDHVYVSDDQALHALDVASGQLVWSAEVTSSAPPTSVGGAIYVISAYTDTATALDRATGELLWSTEIGDIFDPTFPPPTVVGDTWYFLSDELRTGDSSSTLHALDVSTGKAVWASELPLALASSPAVVADGAVFVSDITGVIHALDAATGHRVWASEPQLGARLVTADGVILSNFFGYLYVLDAATGEQIWRTDANFVGGGNRTYAVSNGTIFVGYRDASTSGVRAYSLIE